MNSLHSTQSSSTKVPSSRGRNRRSALPSTEAQVSARATEYQEIVGHLRKMANCSIWGAPSELCSASRLAIDTLLARAQDPFSSLPGMEIVYGISPELRDELMAYELCAQLQYLEGVASPDEPCQPWTRRQCQEALEHYRALARYQHQTRSSSFFSSATHYGPAPLSTGSVISFGLSLSR